MAPRNPFRCAPQPLLPIGLDLGATLWPMDVVVPQRIEELGLRRKLLEDLALKTIFISGELTLTELAASLRIDVGIVDALFQRFRRDQLCHVTGMAGSVHRIVLTSEGKVRAVELLAGNQYAGPAPVPIDDYVACVKQQTVRHLDLNPGHLRDAFAHLVLDERVLMQLGTAFVSGKALFLFGPPGSGKTTIAETLALLFRDDAIRVPYAVETDGQVIAVFDPHVHVPLETGQADDGDGRWVTCRRPAVMVGGELSIEMLDLQLNPITKYYAAPVQMKANNGLLIVDDFGRQRVRPEELLNRWVVPLDRGMDYFTLTGGKKVEVPFDVIVVFATNLDPSSFVDEAFLRRIQTKIRLGDVTPRQFHQICRRVCEQVDLAYDAAIIDRLITLITADVKQPLRACHPRDIIQQICWSARYQGVTPKLTDSAIARACQNYFLDAT
jgi:predicted ATPase with chaperone activity